MLTLVETRRPQEDIIGESFRLGIARIDAGARVAVVVRSPRPTDSITLVKGQKEDRLFPTSLEASRRPVLESDLPTRDDVILFMANRFAGVRGMIGGICTNGEVIPDQEATIKQVTGLFIPDRIARLSFTGQPRDLIYQQDGIVAIYRRVEGVRLDFFFEAPFHERWTLIATASRDMSNRRRGNG